MKAYAILNPTRSKQTRQSRVPERGMTLVITLGFLAVLMMLAMSLAITARTERRAAAVNADVVRSRMLAESALDRAISCIETQYGDEVYPGTQFYQPGETSAWAGRSYLASMNGSNTAGIEDGLAVNLGSAAFTPEAELDADVGWTPIRSNRSVDGEEKEVLIGRYAWVIIDESGKIDPGAVVSASEPEGEGTRTGASVTEISLSDAGLPYPQRFRPQTVDDGAVGSMPDSGRWFSVSHIARALQPNQSHMDAIVENLHPFSYDTEVFWRDSNNNGAWDGDEAAGEDRLDLAGSFSINDLYDLFLGPDKSSTDDDCAWLKQLDNNTWVQTWKTTHDITTAQARQRVAAQIAANIVDYADTDSVPTPAHVDAAGAIQPGTTDAVDTYSVIGVEQTWGVSEVAMRVKAEIVEVEPPPGTCNIAGDLNINPGNSWFEFILDTPSGQITRDTLHDQGAGFGYSGQATSVKIKVKAAGRVVTINGQEVTLNTNDFYTISVASPMHMSVNLRNLNPTALTWPHAMGHWWIYIAAVNATITPPPAIPPPVPAPTALRITPGYKGEVFFPYGTGADIASPPGALTISYDVEFNTEIGATGRAQGAVAVAMDQAADVDGGTLVYSSAYTDATPVMLYCAFNPFADPPLIWYNINLAQTTAATLEDTWGNVVDTTPIAAAGGAGRYLCNWAQDGNATVSASYYAGVSAGDPMSNDRGEGDNDFAECWTALPDANLLSSSDQAGMGALSGSGYNSADFCDSTVKNSSIARIGELGRIHSYQPMRSLRLWAASGAGEAGHDAEILDLFKIGADSQKRGKINVNTLQPGVLQALFANASTEAAADAAAAVLAKRAAGTTFTNIGQLFGGVAGISGSTPAADDAEEAAVAKLAELVTVRPNYFTVVVTAQAIKDVGGVRYTTSVDGVETLVTAEYGTLDVSQDADGGVIRYIDPVLAEQKLLAVVYRDGFTNELRIERFEFLTE